MCNPLSDHDINGPDVYIIIDITNHHNDRSGEKVTLPRKERWGKIYKGM